MRIIAGEWRGRPIAAPEGPSTRPTSDRAREGLFSMLVSRIGTFEGLHIADLFAGSGALGLEALSRGAAHCLFVDNDRAAIDAIRSNALRLGAGQRAEIRQQSAEHAMAPSQPCDIVFLDPPYGSDSADAVLRCIATEEWLAPHALVSVETDSAGLSIPDSFSVDGERRFGKARILLLRAGPPAPG